MYRSILRKVNSIHAQFQIDVFPVPIHIIENIISTNKFCFSHRIKMNQMIVIDNTIISPPKIDDTADYRYKLAHELGHIILHPNNHFFETKVVHNRREKEADVFAAYFLMPDKHMLFTLNAGYQEYDWIELYGVPEKLITIRKQLIIDSLNTKLRTGEVV